MKIIFLDIDGVLNHQLWFEEQKEAKDKWCSYDKTRQKMIDPSKVELLNELIEKTGSKVVISSSWRVHYSINYIREMLSHYGFKGEIIDTTPTLFFRGLKDYHYSVPRGNEIKAWLETNKDILGEKISKVRYVILDDDSDMLLWQRENFFWVDPYCGLTPNITYKAIRYLNK